MSVRAIRPKAVCVFRRGPEILVGGAVDSVKGDQFYGPPGGGIEFGEYAADAARREMREELGVEIEKPHLIGVLENVFEYEGQPGHDILFVFSTRFVDETLYETEAIDGVEGGIPMSLTWEVLESFSAGGRRLVPDGLFDLLAGVES